MPTYVYKNTDELSESVAEWMQELINGVLKDRNRFTIALSGGSTPMKLYRLLASDRFRDSIDWSKIHFFWGDERYVPFEDDLNNAKMAFEELLDKVPVNKEHVHVMRTDLPPEESAIEYERILREYFEGKPHTFDLVLLGLGDNAHTLSLFPGYDIVHEEIKWVSTFYLKEQSMYRITLTAPVVNKAGCVAYLVGGGGKAKAVKEILHGPTDPDQYPAQVIQPVNGQLYWFLDEPSASELS